MNMSNARPNPKPPELRIVRRRTVDLDPAAAKLVRDAAPHPVQGYQPPSIFFAYAHPLGLLAAALVVLWLAFTLLPRAW